MKRSTWRKVERNVRRLSGGRETPGSGNKGIKGDVQTTKTLNEDGSYDSGWQIEVKCTEAEKFTVQNLWFEKLIKECGNRKPALVLQFLCPSKAIALCLVEGIPSIFIKKTRKFSQEEFIEGTIIEAGNKQWRMENAKDFLKEIKTLKPGAPSTFAR